MNRKLPIFILLVGAVAFTVGLANLFQLRFASGDVYPPYSSLRSDPLGASAVYEGLERLPGMTVSRDFSADNSMPDPGQTAYLHLAGESDEWDEMSEETFRVVDEFVRGGGRLVVAFAPVPARPSGFGSTAILLKNPRNGNRNTNAPPAKPGQPNNRERDRGLAPTVSLTERWGFGFDVRDLKEGEDGAYAPIEVLNANVQGLPLSLTWHSGEVFTNLNPAWRVIFSRGREAVMIERTLGRGSLVFASDAYFLSNEAMEKERHADLLAWVIGPSRRVVFDEAHLGIVEQPGVAMLFRKYQLGGFIGALLALAALFIWKNSNPLAPATEVRDRPDYVVGRDFAAGFVNLLRRHVPHRELLHLCLTEWRKSKSDAAHPAPRLARAQAVIEEENSRPPRERDPLRTYREICRALNEK